MTHIQTMHALLRLFDEQPEFVAKVKADIERERAAEQARKADRLAKALSAALAPVIKQLDDLVHAVEDWRDQEFSRAAQIAYLRRCAVAPYRNGHTRPVGETKQ